MTIPTIGKQVKFRSQHILDGSEIPISTTVWMVLKPRGKHINWLAGFLVAINRIKLLWAGIIHTPGATCHFGTILWWIPKGSGSDLGLQVCLGSRRILVIFNGYCKCTEIAMGTVNVRKSPLLIDEHLFIFQSIPL